MAARTENKIPLNPSEELFFLLMKAAHAMEQMLAVDMVKLVARILTCSSPKSPLKTDTIAMTAVSPKNPINPCKHRFVMRT